MKIINKNVIIRDEVVFIIGYFETFHKGHLELIKKAREYNKKIVISMWNNKPISTILSIKTTDVFTFQERLIILEKLDIDYVLVFPNDKQFFSTSWSDFNILIKNMFPNLYKIIVGEDFTYGKKAAGNCKNLEQSFDVDIIKLKKINNEKISSTLISNYLTDGKITEVNSLLFKNYFVYETVVRGNAFGTKIGYPTANIKIDPEKTMPKNGIYSCKVTVLNKIYTGALCISDNPTISDSNILTMEVYIINFNKNIYGEKICVEIIDFIRDVEKYKTLDLLKEAIKRDIAIINKKVNIKS